MIFSSTNEHKISPLLLTKEFDKEIKKNVLPGAHRLPNANTIKKYTYYRFKCTT